MTPHKPTTPYSHIWWRAITLHLKSLIPHLSAVEQSLWRCHFVACRFAASPLCAVWGYIRRFGAARRPASLCWIMYQKLFASSRSFCIGTTSGFWLHLCMTCAMSCKPSSVAVKIASLLLALVVEVQPYSLLQLEQVPSIIRRARVTLEALTQLRSWAWTWLEHCLRISFIFPQLRNVQL